MSSEYSRIDPRSSPSSSEMDNETDSPGGQLHNYVNLPGQPPLDEEQLRGRRSRYNTRPQLPPNRKSRSRERPRTENVAMDDRIRERERELERIHRRSRELMLSPRYMDCRSREGSLDRGKVTSRPPPLPPRVHSPPCVGGGPQANRYKSPSPGLHAPPPHRHHHAPAHSHRRRVQSPNRRDFKDFSQHPRDFRSPMKHRYLEEDEDSGADSLGNELGHPCHMMACGSAHGSSMALVPYDPAHGCCARGDFCCSGYNRALQTIPGVEERLIQLEGDKDSLHLQVAMLSNQIDAQTDKIHDLEKILDDKKDVLKKTEDILQREMISRSSLETKKLELMSELSSLKLRQAAIERENGELRKKLSKAMNISSNPTSDFSGIPMMDEDEQPKPVLDRPHFGTMPRRYRQRDNSSAPLETHFSADEAEPRTAGFGKAIQSVFQRKITNAHSGSAPSLVQESRSRQQSIERFIIAPRHTNISPPTVSPHQPPIATKPKGLKRIWGKMRRSNSGTLHEDRKPSRQTESDTLKRGGFRASAGSRFAGWMGSSAAPLPDPSLPFRQWKVDTICSWLDHLGLYMYSSEVRKNVKTGEQFLAMTNQELETKIGIKHPLHRKKVLLALQAKQQDSSRDQAGRLDHQWVVRWLDDVGLPQYKDAFLEARVDGRMLHYLTVEDLFQLKVTNMLHHLSLKRGIQVLRKCGFEASCLKRRAMPEDKERDISSHEVALWTNHRVMEWLRHADLSEYAPNLRGSGVHGALMCFEPRFTSDLLATLLSIPTTKTLLRRHLNLHFRDLLGRDVMQLKREAEQEPNFQILTPTAKVKQQKKSGGQFTLRRKKSKSEVDFEDLVCPIDSSGSSSSVAPDK